MEPQSSATLPTVLRAPPTLDAYVPLAEHQSRTPATFFNGPPVLHFHSTGARVYVGVGQQGKLPWNSTPTALDDGTIAAAAGAEQLIWPVISDTMVFQTVDVFVGSDTLTLYSPDAGCGLALPYPVIGLHAIKTAHTADGSRVPTVYMQLGLGTDNGDGGEDEDDTVELLLVLPLMAPRATSPSTESNGEAPPEPVSDASALFDAISACADLHPDRFGDDDDNDDYPSFFRHAGETNGDEEYDDEEGDDDDDGILVDGADGLQAIDGFRGVYRPTGGDIPAPIDLPPPLPGSGGWITAENAHEFFDEEGNWRGRGGQLGGGAGRVRGRDELEGEAAAAAPVGGADEATKAETEAASATTAAPAAEGAQPDGELVNGSSGSGGEGGESKRLRTE